VIISNEYVAVNLPNFDWLTVVEEEMRNVAVIPRSYVEGGSETADVIQCDVSREVFL